MQFFSKISTGLLLICSFTIGSPNPPTAGRHGEFQKRRRGDIRAEQALGILQEIIISLDFLLKLNVEPIESVKDLRDKYLRIAQPFKLLLGNEDVWTGKGVLNPRVREVRDVYAAYLHAHTVDVKSTKPHYYLRGGDHWLQYLPPDAKDPREKGKTDAAKYTLAHPRPGSSDYPHGAMLAPGIPDPYNLIWLEEKPQDLTEPWCFKHSRTKAVTNGRILIFCRNTYMPGPTYGDWSKQSFPPEDIEDDKIVGESLDIVKFIPAVTWIHEMGHYVKGWPEPKAPDPDANSKMNPVYNLDMALSLSKNHKGGAIEWPENLALFEAAMHMDKWYWGSGKAEKKPDAESAAAKKAQAGISRVQGRRSVLLED